jgi:hypothetical protein
MAPLTGKGISPSKTGPVAPFLATIQALSSTRVFLLSENERKLLCMGRTFNAKEVQSLTSAENSFSL